MSAVYNILLVDDLKVNLDYLRLILEDNFEHLFLTAQSAKEALTIINKTEIDLILTDVQMPQYDGFEFTKFLKKHKKTKDIPVLFISGEEHSDAYLIKGFNVGAIGYILKPINPVLLIAKLQNYFKIIDTKKETERKNFFISSLLNASKEAQIVMTRAHKIININESAKKMFAYTPIMRHLHELLDCEEFKERVLHQNQLGVYEDVIQRYKKDYYYVSVSKLQDGYLLLSFRNITSSHKQTLRQQKIFDLLGNIVVVTNGKNLVNINKRFFDIHDFEDYEDFISKHNCICELFISKEGENYLQIMNKGVRWNKYILQNKNEMNVACIVDKFGEERFYEVVSSGRIFQESDEEDEEEVIIFNDITQIKKQSTLLEEQSRFASMGEMISMIAHQWRQPLTTLSSINLKTKIQNSIGELSKKELAESNEKSNNIIRYLNKTIDDFRDFFDNKDVKSADSLENIVKKTLGLLEAAINDVFCEIHFEYKDGLKASTYINIYESKLGQVLLNIIKNSLDEYKRVAQKQPRLNIQFCLIKEYLCIKLLDNAGGIPSDIISKIFDPYFSTKSKNGTGIGLYMSKIIVEQQMHGKLSVENADDGACFTILLPKEVLLSN